MATRARETRLANLYREKLGTIYHEDNIRRNEITSTLHDEKIWEAIQKLMLETDKKIQKLNKWKDTELEKIRAGK